MLRAVRGAVGVPENTHPAIREATARPIFEVLKRNRLVSADVECL